jgi:hypothetical protein
VDGLNRFGFGRWSDIRMEHPTIASKTDEVCALCSSCALPYQNLILRFGGFTVFRQVFTDYALQYIVECSRHLTVAKSKTKSKQALAGTWLMEQLKLAVIPLILPAEKRKADAAAAASASASAASPASASSSAKADLQEVIHQLYEKSGRDLLGKLKIDSSLSTTEFKELLAKDCNKILQRLERQFHLHCSILHSNPKLHSRYPATAAVFKPTAALQDIATKFLAATSESSTSSSSSSSATAASTSAAASAAPLPPVMPSDLKVELDASDTEKFDLPSDLVRRPKRCRTHRSISSLIVLCDVGRSFGRRVTTAIC